MFYWLFKQKIKKAFALNERKRSFHSFKTMKTVLILFDYQDWAEVQKIVHDLRENGKKVLLWTILPKKAKEIADDGLRLITTKETSWTKGVKEEVVTEFEKQQYDTLLNLTDLEKQKLDGLTYLLMINKANFCIGIQNYEDFKIFDLTVLKEPTASLEETYKQIKRYTANIE